MSVSGWTRANLPGISLCMMVHQWTGNAEIVDSIRRHDALLLVSSVNICCYFYIKVAKLVARLTRDRWISHCRKFEPNQRPPLFP